MLMLFSFILQFFIFSKKNFKVDMLIVIKCLKYPELIFKVPGDFSWVETFKNNHKTFLKNA